MSAPTSPAVSSGSRHQLFRDRNGVLATLRTLDPTQSDCNQEGKSLEVRLWSEGLDDTTPFPFAGRALEDFFQGTHRFSFLEL